MVRIRVRRYLSVLMYIILSSKSLLYLMIVPMRTIIIGMAIIKLKKKAGTNPMGEVIWERVPIFLR